MVIIKNAHVVITLTFIMTENFPIPLRMLYHIPGTKQQDRRGRVGGEVGGKHFKPGQTDFLSEHEPSAMVLGY